MHPRILVIVVAGLFPAMGIADEPIKVGAIFGLSGSVAQYGEWTRRGVEIARDTINNDGGIGGHRVELVFEDNQGQPAVAASAFDKLVNISRLQFIMTYQSSIALAVAPLANRAKVVQMDVSAFSPKYSSPNDFTFRTGVLVSDLSTALARAMSERFHVQRAALLYIENDKGESGAQSFRDAFYGSLALDESFRPNESDFRSLLIKVRKTGVRDLVLSAHLIESGTLLKQAKELGLELRVFSDVYSVEGSEFLKTAGSAADNIFYIAPQFSADKVLSIAHKFAEEYEQRFAEPPTFFAAQAYDGLFALAVAMRACQQVGSECVRAKLGEISFEGASGPIRFDLNGDVRDKPLCFKRVSGGRFMDA